MFVNAPDASCCARKVNLGDKHRFKIQPCFTNADILLGGCIGKVTAVSASGKHRVDWGNGAEASFLNRSEIFVEVKAGHTPGPPLLVDRSSDRCRDQRHCCNIGEARDSVSEKEGLLYACCVFSRRGGCSGSR